MRTVFWEDNQLKMIDQRRLPGALEVVAYDSHQQVADAIRDMVVRGAPAIGVCRCIRPRPCCPGISSLHTVQMCGLISDAAAVCPKSGSSDGGQPCLGARPYPEQRSQSSSPVGDALPLAVLSQAQRLADEDVEINKRMACHGAALIESGDTIIHHCNTGALAAVDWGTALGVIRMAHEQGKKLHVLVDETRPRLQGARLTAWELEQYGIPYDIITDGMAGYFMRTAQAQKVFFGADRVAANGDVANKIGTYMLSVAAKDNDVPVYAVVPTSTIDLTLENGSLIPIEERDPAEVLDITVPWGTHCSPGCACPQPRLRRDAESPDHGDRHRKRRCLSAFRDQSARIRPALTDGFRTAKISAVRLAPPLQGGAFHVCVGKLICLNPL